MYTLPDGCVTEHIKNIGSHKGSLKFMTTGKIKHFAKYPSINWVHLGLLTTSPSPPSFHPAIDFHTHRPFADDVEVPRGRCLDMPTQTWKPHWKPEYCVQTIDKASFGMPKVRFSKSQRLFYCSL